MRWAEFYEYHDKYKFVGVLRADPVEAAVEKAMAMEQSIKVVSLSLTTSWIVGIQAAQAR